MDNENPNLESQATQQQSKQKDTAIASEKENKKTLQKTHSLGNTSWFFIYLAVIPLSIVVGFVITFILTWLLIFVFPYEFGSAYAVIVFFIFAIILNSIFICPILLLLAGAIKRKSFSKTSVVLLIFIIIFYIPCIYILTEMFSKSGYQNVAVPVSIGDQVELYTTNLTVNGVEEREGIISPSGNVTTAKENYKFVVIELDISNTIHIRNSFYPNENLGLVDGSGVEYQAYFDSISTIAPSMTETGIIVYEVPSSSTNYTLYIFNSNNGEVYKIELN